MIKFTIHGELPALNEIINTSKSNYGKYTYTAMKNRSQRTIAMALIEHKVPIISNKIDVSITWVCKNKRKDKDNIQAGQKFIFDAMVVLGIIKNDGWKEIGDIRHYFKIDKKEPRIEVTLIEVI